MGEVSLERSLVIEAPLPLVWSVVSDLDGYHQHADGLQSTQVVSGEGEGAVRHCVDTSGGDWVETCTLWEAEQRYVVDVDVKSYPLRYRALFRRFQGTWSVAPVETGTEVTIRFEAVLRGMPGIRRVTARLAEKTEASLDAILESYVTATSAWLT